MMAPVPPPAPPQFTTQQKRTRFLLGLGLGLIPLVLALIAAGLGFSGASSGVPAAVGPLLIAAGILFVVAIILMIVFLAITRLRFIGYGLLAAVAATPVVGAIGCYAIIAVVSQPHP